MENNKDIKIDSVSISDVVSETNQQPQSDASTDVNNQNSNSEIDFEKIASLTAQLDELNDKYLRAIAELENTRRRAGLDAQLLANRRAMAVAEKILPVMDAVDVALKHSPDDAGIQSMARALESAFSQIGITKIESTGQILNPQLHNAIQVISAPQDAPDTKPNTIVSEMQSGYMFGDNVLRTAMVIVSK